jgi:phosphatidylethanolamine/phosphatidyl-N-methylethanolamine N-methyltransferase
MSGIKFLKNFIKNPTTIGAVWPTGPSLAKEMVSNIKSDPNSFVAEIGPGTGAITKFIVDAVHNKNNFFAVELNNEFCIHLEDVFPGVMFYNDSASNLPSILKEKELNEGLDAVISGLPWAAFPIKIQISILEAIFESLKPGGKFNTFAYLQGLYLPTGIKFRKLISSYFSEIETSRVVWNNIPPAIVYRCKK